jgi:hypothetical protein
MKRTVVIVAALLALAGCAGSPTSTPRLTAQQVVTALTQRVPTVIPSVVYTAETDPNHLLGRPTGYQSKATFADRRVNPGSATDSSQGSVELGGSVECSPTTRARSNACATSKPSGPVSRLPPSTTTSRARCCCA